MVTWETTTIGELLEFKNGLNKGKEFFGKGTPIVNYMDVYKHRGIRAEQLRGRVTLSAEEIRRFDVHKGDVFFTRTSETPEEVGYAGVMLNEIDDCVFSGFVLRGRPITDKLDIGYCQYVFMTKDIRKAIMSGCTYTTRALTNGRQLSAIEIPLPDKDEQRRIAEALSDTDALLAALEKLIAKKRAIKQGVMQELLTGKRRLPEFEGEWVEKKIMDFPAEVVSGGTPSTFVSAYWDGAIPWMNSGELNLRRVYSVEGRITQLGLENSSTTLVAANSVLIGLAGQGKTRGTVAMNYIDLCTNQSIAAVLPNPSIYNSEYLYQNLDSRYDELRELSTGDGGRGGLNLTILRNLTVSFPSLEEQTAIAEILSDMDAEIDALMTKLNKLRNIKQGMMSELLTGRKSEPAKATVEAYPEAEAEPIRQVAKQPATKGHNQQFDDAVMIAGIVNALYSNKYPLGRKKVQKCLYLLRRHQDESTETFKKKAAGPYADEVRYKGGEPIARSSNYIATTTAKQGTTFARGKDIGKALGYIQNWGKQADIQWVADKLKFKKVDELELLATVDMAICDLTEAGIPISVRSIKHLIATNEEWKAKLKKQTFSDANVTHAIRELNTLL
jgi:type I restriction enzyme S subunit